MSDSNSVCSHATDEEVVEALNIFVTSLKLTNDARCLVPTLTASLVLSMFMQQLLPQDVYITGVEGSLETAARVLTKFRQRMLLDLAEPTENPQ